MSALGSGSQLHGEDISLISSNSNSEAEDDNFDTLSQVDLNFKTKRFTNNVHTFFKYDGKSGKSCCKQCGTKISGRYTTNLRNHVKAKHPESFKELQDLEAEFSAKTVQIKKKRKVQVQQSTSIVNCFAQMKSDKECLRKGSPAYNEVVNALACAFVSNSLPYRLIEQPSFVNFINKATCGRLVDLPNRKQMASIIKRLTLSLKESIVVFLEGVQKLSVTVDLWSRPGNSAAFVGITCHFFDKKSQSMKRCLIACRQIQQPHTAENILTVFSDVMAEWNIDESKVFRIITDNGSNVVKAFR